MDEIESINTESEAHTTYIPSLYIPSEWQPGPANLEIKAALAKFNSRLNELKCNLPKHATIILPQHSKIQWVSFPAAATT
jgi:hypothetical protein